MDRPLDETLFARGPTVESDYSYRVDPWLNIWTDPRGTIRRILQSDPDSKVLLLAGMGGVFHALDRAALQSIGDRTPTTWILIGSLLFGSLSGIVVFFLFGFLISWTGRWFGGQGSMPAIRAAIAWPNVIVVAGLLLWIPQLILFGGELFRSETPRIDASGILTSLLFIFGTLEVLLGIWWLVTLCKCLGEAQGFSARKALGNALAAWAIIVVPIVAIGGVAYLLFVR